MHENGFVFLDHLSRPYYVAPWGQADDWWLFYWHPDHKWVSLRQIWEVEWHMFSERRLARERAELYFQGGPRMTDEVKPAATTQQGTTPTPEPPKDAETAAAKTETPVETPPATGTPTGG